MTAQPSLITPDQPPLVEVYRGWTRWDWLGLLLIIVLAALLRFIYPDIIEFRQDEAALAHLALDMTDGIRIPLLGIPSSTGVPNSPITVYTLLPTFFVTDSPQVATQYVALLNVIGVAIFWCFVRRYFGAGAAFFAGLLYAVHPWVVLYSRKLWAQSYHTPLIMLALFLAIYGFWETRSRWARAAQVLSLPLLVAAMQIHFAAWIFLAPFAWIFWRGRRNTTWKIMAVSLFLSVLAMTPYLLGVPKYLQDNTRRFGYDREWTTRHIVKPIGQMFWVTTNNGLDQYFAREVSAQFQAEAVPFAKFWLVAFPLVVIGVLYLYTQVWTPLSVFTLAWAFIAPLALVVGASLGAVLSFFIDAAAHYYIPMIPVVALLTGLGLLALWRIIGFFSRPLAWVGVGGLTAALVGTQAWSVLRILLFVNSVYTPTQFGFGTPLHNLIDVKAQLAGATNMIIVPSEEPVQHSDHGADVWRVLLHDQATCVREVLAEDTLVVIPQGKYSVMFAPNATTTAEIEALYRSDTAQTVTLRPGEGVYQINQWDAPPNWDTGAITPLDGLRFSNDVALTGYQWNAADKQLLMRWQLPAANAVKYAYKLQYLDANNTLIGEDGTVMWDSANWCEGDQLFDWAVLNAPDTTATIRLQLVNASNNQQINLSSGASGDVLLPAGES